MVDGSATENTLTLEFRNLPLVEVQVNLHFAQVLQFGLDVAYSLRDDLRADFPIVESMMVVALPPSPFPMAFGPAPPGLVLANPDGMRIGISPATLTASWRAGDPDSPYVRFGRLKEAMEKAAASLSKSATIEAAVVNLSYSHHVPISQGGLNELFIAEVQPPAAKRSIVSYNVAWQESETMEIRLVAEQISDELFHIGTSAGTKNPALIWHEALQAIHDELQSVFVNIITEKAKEIWQLQNQ